MDGTISKDWAPPINYTPSLFTPTFLCGSMHPFAFRGGLMPFYFPRSFSFLFIYFFRPFSQLGAFVQKNVRE